MYYLLQDIILKKNIDWLRYNQRDKSMQPAHLPTTIHLRRTFPTMFPSPAPTVSAKYCAWKLSQLWEFWNDQALYSKWLKFQKLEGLITATNWGLPLEWFSLYQKHLSLEHPKRPMYPEILPENKPHKYQEQPSQVKIIPHSRKQIRQSW